MLYRCELFKAFRAWSSYLGPVLVMATVLCAPAAYRFEQDGLSETAECGIRVSSERHSLRAAVEANRRRCVPYRCGGLS